jgi:hypothetical protein
MDIPSQVAKEAGGRRASIAKLFRGPPKACPRAPPAHSHKKAGAIESIVRFLQVDIHQTTEEECLSSTQKNEQKLSDKTFGEPGKRAYPMPDKSHAAAAKARASQAVKVGRMSKAEEHKIDAKADKVIKKHR